MEVVEEVEEPEVQVDESDQNKIFCKHYKKLIVEDFSFNENRVDLHYGKCSLIGLCTLDCGIYFLGNVRITFMNPDSQLPDNVHRVLLLTNLCSEAPPIDKFVEVFGESVLYDRSVAFTDDVSMLPCVTSLDVLRMRSAEKANKTNDANISDFDSSIMDRYRPAIKVHRIVPIDNAHEIINCNLRLKQFIDKS